MPVTPTYPGVYVTEVPSGVRTITGVSTSVAAFVGYLTRGPMDRAVRIFSFSDFEREFGGLHRDSEVSYAVQQFFLNGGTEAYVIRTATEDADLAETASVTLTDGAGGDALVVSASAAGSDGNDISVSVSYPTPDDGTFTLTVTEEGGSPEEFTGLQMTEASIGAVSSSLVAVEIAEGASDRPAEATDEELTGGTDGEPARAEVTLEDATGSDVLVVQAADEGAWGDGVEVAVDYDTTDPDDLFNLTVKQYCEDDGGRVVSEVEVFRNLSMDSTVSSYAVEVVNDGSKLIRISLPDPTSPPTTMPVQCGTTGTDIGELDPSTLGVDEVVDVQVDGTDAGSFSLDDVPSTTAEMRSALQSALRALDGLESAKVAVIGDRLRVTLGDSDPDAVITFADAAASAGGGTLAADVGLSGTGVVAAPQQHPLEGGCDGGPPGAEELLGSQEDKTGLYALEDVSIFNILCIPRAATLWDANATEAADLVSRAVAYCRDRRAFMIVDIPDTIDTVQEIQDWVDENATTLRDRNAALYFPRVRMPDPLNDYRLRSVGPSGTMAGLYARTDSERGVWKAPAGVDVVLRGVRELAYELTDGENGALNPLGINCLRNFRIYGNVAWGARTLRGADQLADEYKYIPVRRLALFLEESLYRGTQWVVFEPNDEPLWSQIRLNVGAFMHDLFRKGAFQGSSPRDAYFVKCDKETTTQNDINQGIVNILVGFAPLKPAEFVIIKISQIAGEIET